MCLPSHLTLAHHFPLDCAFVSPTTPRSNSSTRNYSCLKLSLGRIWQFYFLCQQVSKFSLYHSVFSLPFSFQVFSWTRLQVSEILKTQDEVPCLLFLYFFIFPYNTPPLFLMATTSILYQLKCHSERASPYDLHSPSSPSIFWLFCLSPHNLFPSFNPS